jgi:hypothetical protein
LIYGQATHQVARFGRGWHQPLSTTRITTSDPPTAH